MLLFVAVMATWQHRANLQSSIFVPLALVRIPLVSWLNHKEKTTSRIRLTLTSLVLLSQVVFTARNLKIVNVSLKKRRCLKNPLYSPDSGSREVSAWHERLFTLNIKDRPLKVSIDRGRPAADGGSPLNPVAVWAFLIAWMFPLSGGVWVGRGVERRLGHSPTNL